MYNKKGESLTGKKLELVKKNANLVKKIAYQIKSRLPASVELDDLIQAGMIGLMDAVNKYEEHHGAVFETYASQRIKGSILDELRSADYLPRTLRKNMREIESAITLLEQTFKRQPSELEIAAHLKLSVQDYQVLLGECNGHQLVYYEDYNDPEGTGHGGEHFLDKHVRSKSDDPLKYILSEEFKSRLSESIELLPEREKFIMGMYYEEDMNFKEIGSVLTLSESRVCQLHAQSIARLRASMKAKLWTGVA